MLLTSSGWKPDQLPMVEEAPHGQLSPHVNSAGVGNPGIKFILKE